MPYDNLYGCFKNLPSRINNVLYVFFGKEAEKLCVRKQDCDNDMELILITANEFRRLVLNGECVDSSSMAMFHLAQIKGYL